MMGTIVNSNSSPVIMTSSEIPSQQVSVYKPAYGSGSMTESLGGGVPTYVRDYYSLRFRSL